MPPAFLPAPLTPALALRTRPRERRPRWRCAAPQYVPLHVHSDFSLLDGASQLPALVARAAELGVPALALTDHGVLYGAIGLVRECGRAGVKPIVGNEMYVVNDHVPVVVEKGVRRRRFHLVVLAKNLVGYRNLVMLTTLSHLDGKVGTGIFARPCVSKLLLEKFKEGLIVSSACLGGEVAQSILAGDLDGARNIAMWFRDVFGDDFYLEIQDHGHAEDRIVNPEMLKIAKELDIKVIATNDSHFTSCMDADAHDALICIQTGKLLSDEKRMHYAGNEYFKSVDEMRSAFVDHLPIEDVDVALTNTLAIADKVEKYDLFDETRIPDYPVPEGFDGDHTRYLRHIAKESMRERLAARQAAGLAEAGADHVYMERLEFELEMIDRMGFSSYFLVVWDYIRYARDMLIPVGPGRGSAAGSLVAFALRITDVDPIPFNLLFERFLNPERKSMPDIDTDFSVDGREKIIAYVSHRYGADRVAQIITFNRLTSKAVLKDVARVHDVPYSEADKLAKLIPVVRGKPATLTKLLGDKSPSPEFKSRIEGNEDYLNWIEKARRIEGTNKSFGIHAAGVVISSSPLTDAIPLSRGKHGETITQYPMEDVESLGLLKMDFLGLKNLTVIESALEFINQGRREAGVDGDLDFSVDALPVDDAKTYELLATGELDGIFQLDASAGMRNIVRELKPSSLEDISSILALYRPGPLDAGLIPKFISRKHGLTPIEYDHPLLEPILKETYGIMVYQEQIMRIARDLAGYSLGQADILRRAMGKKKVDEMEREKPRFVSGAVERGVPEQVAINLFEMMIGFAEYCFNKSHSTAYAYLTYQTAYLKANFPVEYSAALLRANMNQSDKLVRYLADANISGVRVMPPSVNRSSLGFTVDRSGDDGPVVLFGLEAVKAVGSSISEAIIEEREARGPYTGILELVERISSRALNKRSMAALILSGAFDEFHPNRKVLHEQLDSLLNLRRKLRDRRKRREKKEMSEEDEQKALEKDRLEWENIELELAHESQAQPDFPLLERLAAEKQTLGFYASGHPLYDLHNYTRFLGCMRVDDIVGITSDAIGASEPSESIGSSGVPDGSEVMIVSCVADFKQLTTARGKKMAKWMIEDACSRVSAIVFPSTYPVVEQRRVPNSDYFSQAPSQINATDVEDESPIVSTQKDASRSELINSSLIEVLSKDVPTDVEEERKELVVCNDARVVVWGKVDRESSGTAQIIVDDVQRIEDVRAVVATARFHPQRTHGVHLTILRGVAAKLLDVSLTDTGEYTYTNKQGESVKRRKRSWSTDLTSKARVPLVLRELGQDGSVLAYTNAGNNLRFTANERMEDLMKALKHDTGFEVELLSVADAAYHRSPEEEADVTSDAEEAERFDFNRRNDSGFNASRNKSIGSRVLLSTGALTDDREQLLSNANEQVTEEGFAGEVSAAPVELERVFQAQSQSDASQALTVEEKFVENEDRMREYAFDEKSFWRGDSEAGVTSSRTDISLPRQRRPFQKGIREEHMDRGVLSTSMLDEAGQNARSEDHALVTTATRGGQNGERDELPGSSSSLRFAGNVRNWESAEAIQKTRHSIEGLQRDIDMRLEPVLELLRKDMFSVISEKVTNIMEDAFKEDKEDRERLRAEMAAYRSVLLRSSTALAPSATQPNTTGSIATVVEDSATETSVSFRGSHLYDENMIPTDSSVPMDAEIEIQSKGQQRQDESWTSSSGNVDTGVRREEVFVSYGEGHSESISSAMSAKDPDPIDTVIPTYWSGAQELPDSESATIGMGLPLCEIGFSGLVDIVCLVAGNTAWSHCSGATSFQVRAVDKLNLTKLALEDDIIVDVTGRMALVAGSSLYVLVSVREQRPSGARKRIRSLATMVVAFEADSVVPALEYKTVKARKDSETVRERLLSTSTDLENFASSRSTDIAVPSSTRQSRRAKPSEPAPVALSETYCTLSASFNSDDASVEAGSLFDGGHLLMWMSRAAESCAAILLQNASQTSRTVGMKGFFVPRDIRMRDCLMNVELRTCVVHIAFGAAVVQVRAKLEYGTEVARDISEDESFVMATFNVVFSPAKFSRGLRLEADEQPLFYEKELSACFAELANKSAT